MIFKNRVEAGKQLASTLMDYAEEETIILAIPRGGVVVGYEIANKLQTVLDVIIPKKIGAPHNKELAIGAITEDGTKILDQKLIDYLKIPESYIKAESEKQRLEIERRLKFYRGNVPYPKIKDRKAIIVDDGIATGATIRAALASIRKKGPKSIVIGVPVAPTSTIKNLMKEADKVICLYTPEPFFAIGQFYRDFTQTSDEEVIKLIKLNRERLKKR